MGGSGAPAASECRLACPLVAGVVGWGLCRPYGMVDRVGLVGVTLGEVRRCLQEEGAVAVMENMVQ